MRYFQTFVMSALSASLALMARPSPRLDARRAAVPTSIAQINRHTGKPHEHRREIARRLRQANAGALPPRAADAPAPAKPNR